MYTRACVFVQKMKRKHGANPVWVWGLLEENYNYLKGDGHFLSENEMKDLEEEIIEGLAVDNSGWRVEKGV